MPIMQTDLPFRGVSALARHCSAQGAAAAQPRAGSQLHRVLDALDIGGPQTRHELASATRIAETTLCARLRELTQRGLVQEAGSVIGPFGVRNIRYARR